MIIRTTGCCLSVLKVTIVAFIVVAGWSTSAQAAGTAAGSEITNETTITYQVSGVSRAASASVSTQVAEIIDFSFTKNDTATEQSVSSPVAGYVEIFNLANTGNGSESFSLQIDQGVADDFDLTNAQIFIEDGTTPNFQAAEDVPYASAIQLGADESIVVYLVFDVPAGVNDGELASAGMTALSNTSGAAGQPVGTILAGQGESGVDAVLAVESAALSQSTDYRTSIAELSVVKTVNEIVDPFGASLPVPGAILTYRIAISVTGSGQADNVIVSDPLPEELTYIANSMTLNGASVSDATGDDQAEFVPTNNEVLVDLGTVAAGATAIVEFKAEIK